MKFLVIFFLNYFLIFILILIRPFKKIKLFEIETRAIGHYSLSVEIFLSEIKEGLHPKNEKYIAISNKKVANKFLLEKWKNFFFVLPSNFYFFYNFLRKFKYGYLFLAPYRDWKNEEILWNYIDIHNVLKKTTPFIKFNKKEIYQGLKLLKSFGINDYNYFCFTSRTGHYRGDFDANANGDEKNLVDAIKQLQFNYKGIRIGSKDLQNLDQHYKIINYSNSKYKSEFNDIFLTYNCKFMISNGTGIDRIPLLNRKKTLLINYFSDGMWDIHSEYSFFLMPKKIKCLKSNRMLPYREIFKKGLYNILSKKELEKNGYAAVECSTSEILKAINEIYDFTINNKKINYSKKINDLFWNNYQKEYNKKTFPKNVIISPSFVRDNFLLFQ